MTSNNCIFCDIANNKTTTTLLYSSEEIIAFNDLKPQAPQHLLIVPKKHLTSLNEAKAEDSLLLGSLLTTAASLAKTLEIATSGYRLILNTNAQGGQTVFHLHLHLLGGRELQWPPG
jgi:histidine triad (HIT) family protein